jgi:membrane protein YdbS with pleckstrin-like domain
MKALERVVVSILKIPPPPHPPEGRPDSQARFRPGAAFYRYLLLQWGLTQAAAAVGVFVGIGFAASAPRGWWDPIVAVVEGFGVLAYLSQLLFSLAALSLDYRMRWYLVSDRALRIREGIFTTHEQTMSFANLQNLEVKQGPLQRLLGISDVEVTSAGGGGLNTHAHPGQRDLHKLVFRGVDDPQRIRGLILERQRNLRDAGLGDPDDLEGPEDMDAALVEAARALTRAARTLAQA